MREASAVIIALLAAPVVAQEAHVYQVEELAEGVQAQALEAAADGKAVALAAGESVLLTVPVGGGVWRVTITATSLADGPAAVASLVDEKQPGRHFIPADKWGRIGVGVETGESQRKALIKLTAEEGAVALDTLTAEEFLPSRKSAPLREPGKIVRETPLIEQGKPTALLLLPVGDEYQAAAMQFAAAFKDKTGVELPVKPEDEATQQDFAAQTCIMAGNLTTGTWSLRLHARRLIHSDATSPGEGGHELRVVHDPWGTGKNAVYLGGSGPAGVRAAGAALLERIEAGERVVLGPLIDWQSEAGHYGPVSDQEIGKSVEDAREYLASFRSARQYSSACGRATKAALRYYLSGEESQARQYEAIMRMLASFYEEHDVAPPTFALSSIVCALDQVEECPAVSDEARLIAAEWIRRIVEDAFEYWEMRGPIAREAAGIVEPTWNHETHPSLGIAYAVEYFGAHYDLPQAVYWKRVVDNLFEGQAMSYKPLEDSANYQWLTLNHTMQWALITGKMDFFSKGVVRKSAELAIACHDNFGHEATFGDAWYAFHSTAGQLFRRAALYYREPRYQFMLDRLAEARRIPTIEAFSVSRPSDAPDNHIGLSTFILDPAVQRKFSIGTVPAERSLDKAVLRGGWDPQDQYLMLDGISVGNHGQRDANAIIRFCDNGRLWLVDMDYIRAAPKWHNSIMIARDGETQTQPPLCELTCEANLGEMAMVQSRLPGYAWTDWTRNIFWRAEDFFVVIDELAALEDGDFLTQCIWRTLGEESLEGRRRTVEQEGERFVIVNADGSRPIMRERWDRGHDQDRGYYAKYEHADKITKSLYQVKSARQEAGEVRRYVNLFYTESGEGRRELDVRVLDDGRVVVTGGEAPAILGLGPWETADARIDAKMFMLSADRLCLADVTSAQAPGLEVTANEPSDVAIQLPSGEVTQAAEQSATTKVQVDAAQVRGWLGKLVEGAREPPQPPPPARPELPGQMELLWEADLGSPVTCTDFWGVSAPAQIAVGLEDGRTVLVDADGDIQWERPAEAMVRCVSFCDLDGDARPEVVSGADDAKVRAFSLAGDLLWELEIQRFHGRSGSVATVFPADLDGDGDDEIIAGSDNFHHYGIDGRGKELWRTGTTHASTVGDAGDLDGDGKDEVLAGSEYYGSSILDDNGKRIGGVSGGPNWTAALALDVTGDGTAEALFGGDHALLAVRDATGTAIWDANLGAAVTEIVGLAPNAGGAVVVASSEAFAVYAFDGEGKLVWRCDLPEQVSGLATLNVAVAAACDDGTVYLIAADGTIVAGYREDAPPRHLSAGDLRGAGSPAIIAAYGSRLVALEAAQ